MPPYGNSRRWIVAVLALLVLIFLAVLGGLQAFNTSTVPFLTPDTSGETLVFTGLTVVVFLLLLILIILLFRNLFKVYGAPSSAAIGARLRTRMVLGATLIALTPAIFMFLFNTVLMNRSIDRWFSPNTSELREDSSRVVLELAQYVSGNARGEAESIAASGAAERSLSELESTLASHRMTLDGGFAVVYSGDRHVLASFQVPPDSSSAIVIPWLTDGNVEAKRLLRPPLSSNLIPVAQRTDAPVLRVADQEYALGLAITPTGKFIVTGLPMPQDLNQTTARIRAGAVQYWQLFRRRNQIRAIFFMMLLLITVLVIFASVWLAVFLSKQITRPVESLAVAMDEIAAGKYGHRVRDISTGEMSDLIRAFNHMAADLDAARQLADSSSAQLTAANLAVETRRRQLETILETIPSGVVTLDALGGVLQSNRAFAVLLGLRDDAVLLNEKIESFFPPDCAEDLAGVIRRGQRMGAASVEVEFHARGRFIHLSITSARLDLAGGQHGTLLVVEDMTDLLRAQRQLAWKEVAQRVAHEIKNPLTPIALSAERIARQLDRAQPDSTPIIRKCSEIILGCVGTLRTLVDQFSALAEFPALRPKACDANRIAEEALAVFAGRLDGITVEWKLALALPPVLADSEAIRRALANLVDNAAEAMQGSLLRILTIESAVSDDGLSVEVAIADTGRGLTDEIRERLFLPFYSTKQRGTGLGLSIAAKIVQEHGGTLRAESNVPKGARFIMRLPIVQPRENAVSSNGVSSVSTNGCSPASAKEVTN